MRKDLCLAVALALSLAGPAGLEARPQTPPQQVDPFYLKMLDAGERSLKAGAFTEAVRDLEIAVFGLGRDPRLTGKAYLLLSVCRDAMLDKDKSRANLATAASLLGPEGASGLGLDERTLAAVRALAETYRIPLALPPPPAPVKVEPKPEPPPPAPKVEKAPPETKKVPPEKKKEEAGKPKTREAKPAAKNPEPDKRQEAAKSGGEAEAPPKKPATKVEAPLQEKVPVKVETAPAKKEKSPPAKEPAKIEGPKPVFRPAAESLPDVKDLEKRLAADPGNAALVYEIVPRYFQRKDFKAARRALEGLRAGKPLELRARLLLARTDFFLKDYATSLEEFQAISSPSSKARPGPEDSRTIALYTALCLANLDQIKSAASILGPLRAGLTPEGFAALIEAEGLAAQWAALERRLGK